jgi:hypothetical protein
MACAISEGARAGLWLVVVEDDENDGRHSEGEEERCTATGVARMPLLG